MAKRDAVTIRMSILRAPFQYRVQPDEAAVSLSELCVVKIQDREEVGCGSTHH